MSVDVCNAKKYHWYLLVVYCSIAAVGRPACPDHAVAAAWFLPHSSDLWECLVDALQAHPVLHIKGLVQLEVPVLPPELHGTTSQHSTADEHVPDDAFQMVQSVDNTDACTEQALPHVRSEPQDAAGTTVSTGPDRDSIANRDH
jgi:hypothetical protein